MGEVGWGAVTTRLVAERAGVNAALVHYHFSSVPELLSTAALQFASKVLAESAEALSGDPADGIERMLAELSRYTGTDPESLLLAEAFLAAHRIGVTTIILPRENEKDLADVPKNVLEALTVELVGHIDEVLKIALVPPAPAQPQEAAEPSEGTIGIQDGLTH